MASARFHDVAAIVEAPTLPIKQQLVKELFQSHPQETHDLLCLLLPSKDRDSVFGMKTSRILNLWKDALGEEAIESWKRQPEFFIGSASLTCHPEVKIQQLTRDAQQGYLPPTLTVKEIIKLRRNLTKAYKRNQQGKLPETTVRKLNASEAKALFLILLKVVTLGISPNQILQQLDPDAPSFLRKQNSLTLLEKWYGTPKEEREQGIAWGVPITPMTCETCRHHALLPWLFTRDKPKQIPPKNTNLTIDKHGTWWVEMGVRPEWTQLDAAEQPASRQQHLSVLKLFREYSMLKADKVKGLKVTYELNKNGFVYTLVIKDVKRFREGKIPSALEDFVEPNPANKARRSDIFTEDETKVVQSGRYMQHRLQVVKEEDRDGVPESNYIMLQEKYDGERLQLHIDGTTAVLFSKNGYDVSEKYSNVRDDAVKLRNRNKTILDGELIVVGADNKPLPWENCKWKYNIPSAAAKKKLKERGSGGYYAVLYDEQQQEEDAASGISFLRGSDAPVEEDLDPEETLVQMLPDQAHLLFVAFDLLMLQGEDKTAETCAKRYDLLKTVVKKGKHRFIDRAESYRVRTAELVERHLQDCVLENREGLMLKNPDAPVSFGRSSNMYRLKIRGPDINADVVGAGFTLSRNPRCQGLWTAVKQKDDNGHRAYVFVEHMEGSSMKNAMLHVLGLPSKVAVADVRKRKEIKLPLYTVYVEGKTVTWKPKSEEVRDREFTLNYTEIPQDVQWLVNPKDCQFGLSLRGDLRPCADGEASSILLRFPVGRVEFNATRSEADTEEQVEQKLSEAGGLKPNRVQIRDYMAHYTHNTVARLRANPRRENLKEVWGILCGLQRKDQAWTKSTPTLQPPTSTAQVQQLLERYLPKAKPFRNDELDLLLLNKAAAGRLIWPDDIPLKKSTTEERMEREERKRNDLPILAARLRELAELYRGKTFVLPG